MPQARSLTASQTPPQGVTLTGLMQTAQPSQQSVSWGEKDFSSLQNPNGPTFDQTTDIAGPLTLAVSGESTKVKGRVVVFGNSQFANDQYFTAYANSDVFSNSVDWAANQNNLINITLRTPITRTFNPPSELRAHCHPARNRIHNSRIGDRRGYFLMAGTPQKRLNHDTKKHLDFAGYSGCY